MDSKEYITITMRLEVEGQLQHEEKKTYHARGRECPVFTLEDFARILFLYNHIFDSSATYICDGLLQEMEEKLPKQKDETAKSLFMKYWVNLKQTINDDFDERNKGEKGHPLYPEENDYLKRCIAGLCDSFVNKPLPVQYGFIWYMYKFIMNESYDEIKQEINNVPEYIKRIVDKMISDATARHDAERKSEELANNGI